MTALHLKFASASCWLSPASPICDHSALLLPALDALGSEDCTLCSEDAFLMAVAHVASEVLDALVIHSPHHVLYV